MYKNSYLYICYFVIYRQKSSKESGDGGQNLHEVFWVLRAEPRNEEEHHFVQVFLLGWGALGTVAVQTELFDLTCARELYYTENNFGHSQNGHPSFLT